MPRFSLAVRSATAMLVLAAPLSAQAAAAPMPLLGEWKADLARSANAPTLLESMTLTFSQRGDTLVMEQRATRGGAPTAVVTTRFLPGGKPVGNVFGPAGQEVKIETVAKWDGKLLVLTNTGEVQGMEYSQQRQYRLGKDGKELASSVTTQVGGMRNEQEILFVQVPAK